MRITLEELREQAEPLIDLLEIVSLEGQHYMARLTISDQIYLLSDKAGSTRLFRSAWETQDTLGSLSIRETQIVHPSAYHEMVGMPADQVEPLRIRVRKERP
ncbi:hypothetical protein LPB19_04580 [Marinobacter salinisoli]|uniref:Cation transporter n=1 Tax=Marinobacter salinisoli TaxID=2769486 RepID=A0ABX7MTS8_9GAMM|nr:DUF6482 family protein [Marinobacter salinisoli]QSP95694.1 hypothetical protein LPB19_04580 [Marinobacter salinisoli]